MSFDVDTPSLHRSDWEDPVDSSIFRERISVQEKADIIEFWL